MTDQADKDSTAALVNAITGAWREHLSGRTSEEAARPGAAPWLRKPTSTPPPGKTGRLIGRPTTSGAPPAGSTSLTTALMSRTRSTTNRGMQATARG